MARKRIYTVLLLAMTVGALRLRHVQLRAGDAGDRRREDAPVVVAASSLDLGAALRAEDLRTINWPSDAVPAGTFASPRSWSAAA